MKKEHAIKWIKALRSGKYKQGDTGYLCINDGYCCLGVLDAIFPKLKLSDGDNACLPHYSKIGLQDEYGTICDMDTRWCHTVSFADLNDCTGAITDNIKRRLSFDEIADIIQIEYVEGL